jgi:hypothetical protein
MSSWMFDGEESQEEIRRRDTRQHQERNGEAAHVEVWPRESIVSLERTNALAKNAPLQVTKEKSLMIPPTLGFSAAF